MRTRAVRLPFSPFLPLPMPLPNPVAGARPPPGRPGLLGPTHACAGRRSKHAAGSDVWRRRRRPSTAHRRIDPPRRCKPGPSSVHAAGSEVAVGEAPRRCRRMAGPVVQPRTCPDRSGEAQRLIQVVVEKEGSPCIIGVPRGRQIFTGLPPALEVPGRQLDLAGFRQLDPAGRSPWLRGRRGAPRATRSALQHEHQLIAMKSNSNHDPDLRTDIEEDDDNIIYLTSIDLVDDKELERFELPTWVAHEPREVRRHNKGLCTKYNTMGLNRRRYYLLMVRDRHVSAEGKKILDQLDDCKKEVVLLQAMLTDINGSIFQMPDVLSKPMKLKKSSK